jgi:hypothetical protein
MFSLKIDRLRGTHIAFIQAGSARASFVNHPPKQSDAIISRRTRVSLRRTQIFAVARELQIIYRAPNSIKVSRKGKLGFRGNCMKKFLEIKAPRTSVAQMCFDDLELWR